MDRARDKANEDGVTKDELDGLESDLEADMPPAVKRQLPDYEASAKTKLESELPPKSITNTLAEISMPSHSKFGL